MKVIQAIQSFRLVSRKPGRSRKAPRYASKNASASAGCQNIAFHRGRAQDRKEVWGLCPISHPFIHNRRFQQARVLLHELLSQEVPEVL